MSGNLSTSTNNGSLKPKSLNDGPGQISTSHQSSNSSQKPIDDGLPTLTPLYEIWGKASQDILKRKDKPEHLTGLTCIDNILWGLQKKVLVTVGARTSHGKSSWAVNLVRHLADANNRVIYFTMETSKEQLLEKLFCNITRTNNLNLLHGKAKTEFEAKKRMFETWISEAKLLIDDKYGYDFPSMLKVIDIIKPDFVIVDYIQMISTKGFRSKVDAIEEYVRKFAELAITNNFGAVLISQINRSGVDEPTMSKFKWAGVLEEHSRQCLILSYDKIKGVYKINVEKNSFGQTGEFEVKFEPEYSSFRDLTEKELEDIEDKKWSKGKTGSLYPGRSGVDR